VNFTFLNFLDPGQTFKSLSSSLANSLILRARRFSEFNLSKSVKNLAAKLQMKGLQALTSQIYNLRYDARLFECMSDQVQLQNAYPVIFMIFVYFLVPLSSKVSLAFGSHRFPVDHSCYLPMSIPSLIELGCKLRHH